MIVSLIRTIYFLRLKAENTAITWAGHGKTDIDEAKVISALQHMSKYKSKFNFDLFWKEIQIFGFPCST